MTAPDSHEPRLALVVSPDAVDFVCLKSILQRQWTVYQAASLETAAHILEHIPIPVVITERDLRPGRWRQLFEQTRGLPHRPEMVVVSRLADESLWTEVLNLGGHDVIAKPFLATEVVRVMDHAWRHWYQDAEVKAEERMRANAQG